MPASSALGSPLRRSDSSIHGTGEVVLFQVTYDKVSVYAIDRGLRAGVDEALGLACIRAMVLRTSRSASCKRQDDVLWLTTVDY